MACIFYREHTIVSSGIYDNRSGQWKLTACVSWQGKTDHIKFLKKPAEIFRRPEDAEEAGVKFSKSWVDDKLDKLKSVG